MRRKGFTLIELLVVITIIAILAAILFPVFSLVRGRQRENLLVYQIQSSWDRLWRCMFRIGMNAFPRWRLPVEPVRTGNSLVWIGMSS